MSEFIEGLCNGTLFFLLIGLIGLALSPFPLAIIALLKLLAYIVVIIIIAMVIGSILNSSL